MEISELLKKTDAELRDLLHTHALALQELRFKAANMQLKEVRKIRVLRGEIARIHTVLSQRALAKQASQVNN